MIDKIILILSYILFIWICYSIGVFISRRSFPVRIIFAIFILGSLAGLELNERFFLNYGNIIFIVLPVACLLLPSVVRMFGNFYFPLNPLPAIQRIRLFFLWNSYKRRLSRAEAQRGNRGTKRPNSDYEQGPRGKAQENGREGAKTEYKAETRPGGGDYDTRLEEAYKLLGAKPDESFQVIRRKFLDLRNDCDPMKYNNQSVWIKQAAHNKAIELQKAYELIKEHLGVR